MVVRRVGRCIVYWLTASSTAWHRRLAAYLLVVAGFALCLQLISANGRQDCLTRRDGREVLRGVVMLVGSDNRADYSTIPSFADLDPATQRFLTDIGSRSAGGESFRDQALRKIPPIDCPQ